MHIAGAASAFPEHYYSQKFLLEQLQQYWSGQLKNPQMLARLHRNVAVEGRHLALPYEKYYDLKTWGCANDVWIQVAQELGEQALGRALHHAAVDRTKIGALFFTPTSSAFRFLAWVVSPERRESLEPRTTCGRIHRRRRLWFQSSFVP